MQCFTQHIYMNKNIREFCMTIGWISHNKLNKNLKFKKHLLLKTTKKIKSNKKGIKKVALC